MATYREFHQRSISDRDAFWREEATAIDWQGYMPPKPKFIGRRVFKNFDLAELAQYIDWGPFFQTWDLAGPYPAILQDEVVGDVLEALRRNGLEVRVAIGLAHGILAQPQAQVLRMGHRLDTLGINRPHLLDESEDALHVPLHADGFRIVGCDACEARNPAHIFEGNRHEKAGGKPVVGETL